MNQTFSHSRQPSGNEHADFLNLSSLITKDSIQHLGRIKIPAPPVRRIHTQISCTAFSNKGKMSVRLLYVGIVS